MAVAPRCVLEELCWQAERDLHQLMVLHMDLHIPEAKMRLGKIRHLQFSICSPKILVFGTERRNGLQVLSISWMSCIQWQVQRDL